jgi:hypothetical protein
MEWIVLFRQPLDLENEPPRVFCCFADSGDDAEIQCRTNNPAAKIVWVQQCGIADVAHAKFE